METIPGTPLKFKTALGSLETDIYSSKSIYYGLDTISYFLAHFFGISVTGNCFSDEVKTNVMVKTVFMSEFSIV